MEIRKLKESVISSALNLVWEVFSEFEAPEYAQEGIDEFRRFLDNADEIKNLCIFCALIDDAIVGVLAMRNAHISLFFVRKSHHKNGIGKALFQFMLEQTGHGKITVNSSPYAVDIYVKLGFTASNTEKTTNGIRYIPMTYEKMHIQQK